MLCEPKEILSDMKTKRRFIKTLLQKLPAGRLCITKDGKGYAFYMETKDGTKRIRKGIGRNKELIYKLANRAYQTEYLRRLENNIALYEKIKDRYLPTDPQTILTSLPENYRLLDSSLLMDPQHVNTVLKWPNPSRDPSVKPVIATLKIEDMMPDEWAAMPYFENQSHPEHKIHRTTRGLLCRSKGEASILEVCDRHGYLYHYDETIIAKDYPCSPDLILIRPDGTLVYVEHRGWHGTDYDRHNFNKDIQYFNVGIVQGRNYLITFENRDGSIDLEVIERQLVNIMGY